MTAQMRKKMQVRIKGQQMYLTGRSQTLSQFSSANLMVCCTIFWTRASSNGARTLQVRWWRLKKCSRSRSVIQGIWTLASHDKHRPIGWGWFKVSRLSHRIPDHVSTLRDVQVLEVGMEYPRKYAFLAVLEWYSFKSDMNYHVTKSHFEKFDENCTIRDERYNWKIIASLWKKIGL